MHGLVKIKLLGGLFMEFTEKTKLGNVLSNKDAMGILKKYIRV
jgi:hypothetical protein